MRFKNPLQYVVAATIAFLMAFTMTAALYGAAAMLVLFAGVNDAWLPWMGWVLFCAALTGGLLVDD